MIEIRRANPRDKQVIWQVRTSAIEAICRSHYSRQEIDSWASSPIPKEFDSVIATTDFVVAERDGLIIGFGFLDRDSAQVEAVFVKPDCQGRGVGSQILAELEKTARDSGLTTLRLLSTLNAVEFYRAAGFEVQKKATYCHASGLELACVNMEKRLD